MFLINIKDYLVLSYFLADFDSLFSFSSESTRFLDKFLGADFALGPPITEMVLNFDAS